jgi:hypothetical protein
VLSVTNVKATPEKRFAPRRHRHYHMPPRQSRDSWDTWVGDRRSRYYRLEWCFAIFVVVAIAGLIVWRVV